MKRVAMVAGLALALCGAAPEVWAKTFTSAEFLTWPKQQQSGYFTTSVTMIGVVAAQRSKDQARCIDNWFASEAKVDHPALRSALRQFPDYHPQGVILWVVQNECGKVS